MSIEALNWARRVGAVGVLRPAEILLLWQLADSANQRDWACWPSQKTLARETNQSLRTVNSQINRLKSLGLIQVEDRRGKGGGRIGLMYYLIEDALDQLLEPGSPEAPGAATSQDAVTEDISSPEDLNANIASRMNLRHANSAFESENGANERHAKVAFESENRTNTRHANIAFGQPKRKLASNPNANSGHSEQVPLKDRARINHHHQSSDARDATVDDDDDDQRFYRRVNLTRLFDDVPGLSGYADDMNLVCAAVDVVLSRARGRIGNPTAYVRTAMSDDLYGVIGAAMTAGSSVRSTGQGSAVMGSPSNVVEFPAQHEAEVGAIGGSSSLGKQPEVPEVAELGSDAVPCTNMDHLHAYEPSARLLARCNHCRLEPLNPAEDARHVANATPDQIQALPERLQRWVYQFQPTSRSEVQGINESV